jgi:hypothetical protein
MARKIAQRHQNKPQAPVKIKIRKEDSVKVIAGKDKGKTASRSGKAPSRSRT